jgi:prefoldin subunit 5
MPINMQPKYSKSVLEAMEKDKPSKEPVWWAKKGCKDCFGRGVVGKTTQIVGDGNKIIHEQLCACVKKAFAVWQEKWVEDHKEKIVKPLRPEVSVSALDANAQMSLVEERIERIDALCVSLKDEIAKLKNRREAIPMEFDILPIATELAQCQQNIGKAEEDVLDVIADADQQDAQADVMYDEVKVIRQRAERLRTVVRGAKQKALNECVAALRVTEQNYEQVKVKCDRELHKVQRKIREMEDKLDRLEERRHKILKNNGLDPVITADLPAST